MRPTRIRDFKILQLLGMKFLKLFLFIIILLAIPVGVLLNMNLLFGGGSLITLGLFGILLYYTVKTIKDCIKKRNNRFNIILQIGVVLTTVVLFSKYRFFRFGDYPALVIIPLFFFMVLEYFAKSNNRDIKLIAVSIIYLILFIPLFCFDFWSSPRRYIPNEWVNRYDVRDGSEIDLPHVFIYSETEQLSQKAYQLKSDGYYYEAMIIFQEAHKIEPKNPLLLFELSEFYARNNLLETAIALLDTAIMIDNTTVAFYNNRGLLHYKLKENNQAIADYLKAVQIDSTQLTLYVNLALAYYYEKKFELVCESINKAEKLGLNMKAHKHLDKVRKRYCKFKT